MAIFCYYVTGHGFGHATRVAEVCAQLAALNHTVWVICSCPDFIFADIPNVHIRRAVLDCGAKQADALTVDMEGSLELYRKTAVEHRDELVATEAAWLKEVGAHVVVSDVVPLACVAGKTAGIPVVCVSNFSWDFIYAEYIVSAGPSHGAQIVSQIADDYSAADVLLRLPGHCPMPAFSSVVDVPLVVRTSRRSREEVRQELGVPPNTKLVLFNFGGQDANWRLRDSFLPEGWMCVVCTGLAVTEPLESKYLRPKPDAYAPDLINASDVILGKIGYGLTSEALAHGKPFIFIRRDHFNEEPFLRKLLIDHNSAVEMGRKDFFAGRWASYLEVAHAKKPWYDKPLNGAQVAAGILSDIAAGKRTFQAAGSAHLRDAVIFGYLMRRGRFDISVPEWYTLDAEQHVEGTAGPTGPAQNIEIVEGQTHGLRDVHAMLQRLSFLSRVKTDPQPEDANGAEVSAAASLFRWDSPIIVSRAPGRLDVMGGIADYSGSLVLQMPISEAAVAAVQLQPGSTALRVVSWGSSAGNRVPHLEIQLKDFLNADGTPVEYATVRKLFEQDQSTKWAALLLGAFVVLMREKGTNFDCGCNILLASDVPQGSGVSSSAAVEVAVMMGLRKAYNLEITDKEVAILCQKVENHVGGAPCGIMDQMASCLGQQNRLLCLLCQPAEVLGFVDLPAEGAFYGINSGIVHSVSGADYGSVRVGAFMGRRLIWTHQQRPKQGRKAGETKIEFTSAEQEAVVPSNFHLANISPYDFSSRYEALLPESIKGQDFLSAYGHHGDAVSTIVPDRQYALRIPTVHPIRENHRVRLFAKLLDAPEGDERLALLGELMKQSHQSYSDCQLGSDGTDLLVELTEEVGQSTGALFGAKITGGGSGGTVCVLARRGPDGERAVASVVEKYAQFTTHRSAVFGGSSMGAAQFGTLSVRVKI